MLTFAGMVLMLVAAKNDAAITPLDSTKTSAVGEDETILWTYDNASDMDTVEWSFKSPSDPTTTIMDKIGAAAATVYNSFNVEHVSNGSITLKAVTLDNVGIYYCTVLYYFDSGHASVTGTVTLSVIEARSPAASEKLPSLIIAIVICCILGLLCIILGFCLFKSKTVLQTSDKTGTSNYDMNTDSHPDEWKKRPQPPPSSGENKRAVRSGSVVSGRDVEMQETDISLNRRQPPARHDKKGKGLSANYTDDDHPLVSINIPTKKAGALESIPDSDRQEVTKKKKKRR